MSNEKISNEVQLARTCADAVNTFSFHGKDFAEEMLKQHPTLQQTFVRECIMPYLEKLSQVKYYDDRSEASIKLAKVLVTAADDYCLPFI